MEDEAVWQRFSFEGSSNSRDGASHDRLLGFEAWAAAATHQRMPTRIALDITGALAFVQRRRIVREVRGVAEVHRIDVRPERRFNPRWIELRRSEPTRS